ncbi:MAG: alanine racemase [Planctomycetota bacterium]|jgi:alanine racemase
MSDTSRILVDLSAVEHNVRVLRGIVGPQCAVCPILKADGYGLGAAQTAKHLVAAGADMLAVYTPAQAAQLARAAVGGPILVLMPVRDLDRLDEAYRLLVCGRLHLTAHDNEHLDDLLRLAEHFATVVPVHVEVDTGMSRGGCNADQVPLMVQRIVGSRWTHLAGLCTHFASAETRAGATNKQLAAFDDVVDKCGSMLPPDCLIHAANTFATLRHRRYHKSMVRVGLAWAGYGPEWMSSGQFVRHGGQLRPILTWQSRIVHVKTIKRGTPVGYGSTWTARRRSRIGLVPVGYADGYPMGLACTDENPKPPAVGVHVGGPSATGGSRRFVRVVGQVNMDQIAVDLTDLSPPGRDETETLGADTVVELIGPDSAGPNHLPTLARTVGTIPHELLCRLNPRLRRIYQARGMSPAVATAAPAAAV